MDLAVEGLWDTGFGFREGWGVRDMVGVFEAVVLRSGLGLLTIERSIGREGPNH